jgi:hypothetical protein
MKARDVMVSPVITAKPSSSVKDVAKLFLDRRISAVPVVDDDKLVGIVRACPKSALRSPGLCDSSAPDGKGAAIRDVDGRTSGFISA